MAEPARIGIAAITVVGLIMGCCLASGSPFIIAKRFAVVVAKTFGSFEGSTAAVSLEVGRHPELESHSDC